MKNSRLRQDLPISIKDRVILPFREGFIFTKLRYAKFSENKVLAKISESTVYFTGKVCADHLIMLLFKAHSLVIYLNYSTLYSTDEKVNTRFTSFDIMFARQGFEIAC